MFHSIISILTTAAVALHAVLGCCAHHAHSCQLPASGAEDAAVVEADAHCFHGHHHHHRDEDDDSTSVDVPDGCDHGHQGGLPHDCDEGDCSFTSTLRSNDVELMLTFSMWSQALGDDAPADALDGLLPQYSPPEASPDPLSSPGSARAKTQVWRL